MSEQKQYDLKEAIKCFLGFLFFLGLIFIPILGFLFVIPALISGSLVLYYLSSFLGLNKIFGKDDTPYGDGERSPRDGFF